MIWYIRKQLLIYKRKKEIRERIARQKEIMEWKEILKEYAEKLGLTEYVF